jgi:hypothetical protein
MLADEDREERRRLEDERSCLYEQQLDPIVDQILDTPAQTIEGLKVKARIVYFCTCGTVNEPVSYTTDVVTCFNIVEDLMRLQGREPMTDHEYEARYIKRTAARASSVGAASEVTGLRWATAVSLAAASRSTTAGSLAAGSRWTIAVSAAVVSRAVALVEALAAASMPTAAHAKTMRR